VCFSCAVLIEDYAEKLNIKAIKEVEKAKVRFMTLLMKLNLCQRTLELLNTKREKEKFLSV
jgi:glycyl-tRNA synthetase